MAAIRRVGTVLAIAFALTFAIAPDAASAQGQVTRISIATGTTGGVYYPFGGALAEIWNRAVPGVEAVAEATGASAQNLRQIAAGQSQVAIAQGDVVYNAAHGEGQFEGRPIETRALMVIYPNVYHSVSLKSIAQRLGLTRIADVKGHRYSVGPPGSGNEVTTSQIFQALGMTYDDIKVQRLSYAETARALREGRLDAGSWFVGLGNATLQELDATNPVALLSIAAEDQAKVLEAFPYYTAFTIPGGTYPSVKEDVETIAVWNIIVVPADLPDDLAYQLAKAAYENVDYLAKVYPPGAPYVTLENLAKSPVPVHPGVLRYLQEQGVELSR
ncbi:TAXI family TRAP transporter solute-binding subunit [Limnochorda pilosa]|uniref:C4-dicarboxylate ABC transporter substrate-binding protein n=1 Tax=Limnochorda pilosa TaxID=1555112 RepID=A0A0K2SFS7_LIMPI|nr:TAXI family TRAP transporter solute-binding subunit [Limnochorda pilosa]BAS25887.1 hypothetical protein LIP_0028 [Limnochorda pilosa]